MFESLMLLLLSFVVVAFASPDPAFLYTFDGDYSSRGARHCFAQHELIMQGARHSADAFYGTHDEGDHRATSASVNVTSPPLRLSASAEWLAAAAFVTLSMQLRVPESNAAPRRTVIFDTSGGDTARGVRVYHSRSRSDRLYACASTTCESVAWPAAPPNARTQWRRVDVATTPSADEVRVSVDGRRRLAVSRAAAATSKTHKGGGSVDRSHDDAQFGSSGALVDNLMLFGAAVGDARLTALTAALALAPETIFPCQASFDAARGATACWSRWLDRDQPSGRCDCESIEVDAGGLNHAPCAAAVAAECRTQAGAPHQYWPEDVPGVVLDARFNCTLRGLVCWNRQQPGAARCPDFELRLLLPRRADGDGSFACAADDTSYYACSGEYVYDDDTANDGYTPPPPSPPPSPSPTPPPTSSPTRRVAACWSRWYDRDNPSGNGDYETFKHLPNETPCGAGARQTPLAVECRTTSAPHRYWPNFGKVRLVEGYNCSRTHGLACRNSDNVRQCPDFEIRAVCALTDDDAPPPAHWCDGGVFYYNDEGSGGETTLTVTHTAGTTEWPTNTIRIVAARPVLPRKSSSAGVIAAILVVAFILCMLIGIVFLVASKKCQSAPRADDDDYVVGVAAVELASPRSRRPSRRAGQQQGRVARQRRASENATTTTTMRSTTATADEWYLPTWETEKPQ